jgi:hypothetical protein
MMTWAREKPPNARVTTAQERAEKKKKDTNTHEKAKS